MVSVQDCQLRG